MRVKIVEYQGVKVNLITKQGFAEILGVTSRTIQNWVESGILLGHIFEDEGKKYILRGKVFKGRFYLLEEARAVQFIFQKARIKKRWKITQETVDSVHDVMGRMRDSLLQGDPHLMRFPLVLEFAEYTDLYNYLDRFGLAGEKAKDMYMAGNKIIEKGDYLNG